MDLQTFIRETLVEIVKGVDEAQKGLRYNRIEINPRIAEEIDPAKRPHGASRVPRSDVATAANLIQTASGAVAEMIEFDIALTVTETSSESSEVEGSGKGGAKLHVASIEIGGSKKSTEEKERAGSSVSRVKFRVPVVFPHH